LSARTQEQRVLPPIVRKIQYLGKTEFFSHVEVCTAGEGQHHHESGPCAFVAEPEVDGGG